MVDNAAAYYATHPDPVQRLLHQMRDAIMKNAPEAIETMNYGIPTFKLKGNLVHYAAFKNHIGFYPGAQAVVDFESKLTAFKCSKGAIQFPLTSPLPLELVAEIVRYRIQQQTSMTK
jgi:uncharacterized protein YdhG (YjbR/CyaY superfamily)